MRKTLCLLSLSFGLFACDGNETSLSPDQSAPDGSVAIAPRIAPAKSLSMTLFNRATTVGVAIADSVGDSLHTIFETSVPFSQRTLTLPAVDRNKHVTVLIGGYDALGNILWAGTTGDRKAGDLAQQTVNVGATITVFPAPTDVHTASLVGNWAYDSTYTNISTGFEVQRVKYQLWVYSNGTFAYNRRQYDYIGSIDSYEVLSGIYMEGVWSTNGTSMIIQPSTVQACDVDSTSQFSCDVGSLPGYTTVYSPIDHELVYDLSWSISAGNLIFVDANNEAETWFPATP